MGVPEPLETWENDFSQILTLGDALGPELWSFVWFMLVLIFLILNILKYMGVYEDI